MASHIFWRSANGRADGEIPVELLHEWGEKSAIVGDQVQQTGIGGCEEIETALRIRFVVSARGKELNEIDTWNICRSALIEEIKRLGGKKPLEPGHFVSVAIQKASTFYCQPLENYLLISSLSIVAMPSPSIRLGSCTIKSISDRRKFPIPTSIEQLAEHSLFRRHFSATNYKWIQVECRGRSPAEAAESAMDALALLRAYWTFICTYNRTSKHWTLNARRKSLSVVHFGPFHTLHHPDGRLVSQDGYWFEAGLEDDRDLFRPASGWPEVRKKFTALRNIVARRPYRVELEALFRRYVTALDQTEPDVALLQLWSLMERVSGVIGERYDEVIRRMIFPIKSNVLGCKRLLESLRIQRNRFTHAAVAANQGDQVAQLAKIFLEPHLYLLATNAYKIASLEEYAELLSETKEVEQLLKLRRSTNKVLKIFHRPTKPKT